MTLTLCACAECIGS